MKRKMLCGLAVLILLLITVGVFLFTQQNIDTKPEVVFEPPSDEVIQKMEADIAERNTQDAAKPPPPGETKESGYWHGDHWHKTSPGAIETANTPRELAEPPTDIPYPSGQTSSNPLFADGVPEHLKCPQKWIGVYRADVSEAEIETFEAILFEIIETYNPKRPIADIWPKFIESEKFYQENDVPITVMIGVRDGPQKPFIIQGSPGIGADRMDWILQNTLDYPEAMTFWAEDFDRFIDVLRVDLGKDSPNWNLITLPDGRTFREKTGYYYEFIYDEIEREVPVALKHGNWVGNRTVMRTGHSGRDAELIRIHLNQTSDEELSKLSGWDYNINPYTQEVSKQ